MIHSKILRPVYNALCLISSLFFVVQASAVQPAVFPALRSFCTTMLLCAYCTLRSISFSCIYVDQTTKEHALNLKQIVFFCFAMQMRYLIPDTIPSHEDPYAHSACHPVWLCKHTAADSDALHPAPYEK